jgi:hypothetical protein
VALLTALSWGPATAGEDDVGTYGAPSLTIPIGAKVMAASDIVAGMQPDASLLFSNPAFVSRLDQPQVFLSTSNWLDDLRLTAASTVLPVGRSGWSFSGGATFLYSGDLAGYDDALNVVAEENYYDMTAVGAVTRRFETVGLSLAFGATYLRQHLYPADGNGYAFTAGAVYEVANNIFHVSAENFGGSVTFPDADYKIDGQNKLGYGRVIDTGHGAVLAGTQVVLSSTLPTRLELGVAYRFTRLLSIRTAVKDVLTSQSESVNLDAGFSVDYNWISLDYAYTPREYFSSTHTFSVSFRFKGAGAGVYNEVSEPATPPTTAPVTSSSPAARPGQTSPVITVTPGAAADEKKAAPAQVHYLIVAGTHASKRSAIDEARSFELLDIQAKVQHFGGKYHVVLGRYSSRKDADKARDKLGQSGRGVRIVVDRNSW